MNWQFKFEPSVWLGLVRAVIVCASAFGFDFTVEQTAGIYLLAEALTSAIQRSVVTPNANL